MVKIAIDDVSFVNLRGEVISRNNLVNEMVKYYQLKVEAGETKVTDFEEGSEIRNLLESIAVDIYYLMEVETDILKQAFVDTATGAWLDKIGMHPFVKLARDTGSVSTGTVKFTIPSELTNDVVIPAGTTLLGDNGLYYTTDYECIISIGETENTISASCVTTGVDGNCDTGTITKFIDNFINTEMITVTNTTSFTDGRDYEDDEVYRSRLLNYIRRDDFGSLPYYKDFVEGIPGVHDVVFVDAAGYTKKVLVNGIVKPTPDTVLLDVLSMLSDLGNVVVGHSFTVGKPVFDSFDLDVSLSVNNELDSDMVVDYLHDYFNGGSHIEGLSFAGLGIGEGVSSVDLSNIFSVFDDVQGATFEIDSTEVTEIPCTANHVLLLDTVTVTQSVIGE